MNSDGRPHWDLGHTTRRTITMATSSIIENIRVNNPMVLKEYVDAKEQRALNCHPRTEDEKSGVVKDPERTRKFMEKVLAKRKSRP